MLSLAHKGIISLQHGKGALQEAYKTCFGAETPARLQRVTDVIGLMGFALSGGHVKWVYNSPDCTPGTNASTSPPGTGWTVQSMQNIFQSGNFQIALCPVHIDSRDVTRGRRHD